MSTEVFERWKLVVAVVLLVPVWFGLTLLVRALLMFISVINGLSLDGINAIIIELVPSGIAGYFLMMGLALIWGRVYAKPALMWFGILLALIVLGYVVMFFTYKTPLNFKIFPDLILALGSLVVAFIGARLSASDYI